jgi:hypothetical protein
MRKLVPQVEKPGRIRGRHVLLGGIVVAWATVALAQRVREVANTRRALAIAAEAKFLDGLEVRSLQTCPQLDRHDPWGEPYQVLCHEDARSLEVVILSYGDGEAIVSSRAYPE